MLTLTAQQQFTVLARNALLRAWKAYGLPIIMDQVKHAWFGQWRQDQIGLYLHLACEHCMAGPNGATKKALCQVFTNEIKATPDLNVNMAEEEQKGLRKLNRTPTRCHHLDAMLGPIPDEVRAISELELLAGG